MVVVSGLEGERPVLFEPMLSTERNLAHFGVQQAERSEVGELAAIGNGDADRVVRAVLVIELQDVACRRGSVEIGRASCRERVSCCV